MVISGIFVFLYCKTQKKNTAMLITEGKITEFFFMTDEFCKVFDEIMEEYTIKNPMEPHYQMNI